MAAASPRASFEIDQAVKTCSLGYRDSAAWWAGGWNVRDRTPSCARHYRAHRFPARKSLARPHPARSRTLDLLHMPLAIVQATDNLLRRYIHAGADRNTREVDVRSKSESLVGVRGTSCHLNVWRQARLSQAKCPGRACLESEGVIRDPRSG